MTEYVPVPEEVTTWVVKVELLLPPCSICRINAKSSTWASTCEYFMSASEGGAILCGERFSSGRCMYMLPSLLIMV